MKHVELEWISNETICFMMVKHRETCWIRMKHGHETPSIGIKQCFMVMKYLESGWNSVIHGHETHCFMPIKHLESGTVITEISIFLYWFLVHCVSCCFSVLFHCCFIAVSYCFKMFHCSVSLLFHGVSSLFFIVFQGVSLPCFICLMAMEQVQWKRDCRNLSDTILISTVAELSTFLEVREASKKNFATGRSGRMFGAS